MNSIIDFAVQKSRAVILILLVIIFTGSSSYVNIPKEDKPDVQIPTIYVHVPYFGVSPGDSEKMIVKPLEKYLKSIDGVKKMTSNSYDGGASVVLEFDAGFDSQIALQDVREKVNSAKTEFPSEADNPSIKEVNLSKMPVLNIILSGNLPETTLYSVVENLKDQITQVKEVLDVQIFGKREEQVDIIIDPLLISSYNLFAGDLVNIISSSNSLVSAGGIESPDGNFAVTVPGLFETWQDVMNLPIKTDGQTVIRMKDVAEVRQTLQHPKNFTRFDSKQAVVLAVSKRTGENIISTIEKVKKIVEAEYSSWVFKDQIKISYSQDESTTIKETLDDLENNIVFAVILSLIPILLTMGLRSSMFVTLSVPASFLLGILCLDMMGLSLNIVVIFSLILSVGMLVDASIVVCEYADRKMIEGMSYKKAYSIAAKRMFIPIVGSTATALIVFVPFFFWPDIIGQFMKFMPVTVIATVISSLVVAFIFIPSLGSIIGKNEKVDVEKAESLLASEENGDLSNLKGFNKKYYNIAKTCLNNSGKFIISIVSFLALVIFLYVKAGNGVEFFPNIEPTSAVIEVKATGNMSIYERDAIVREVEKIVSQYDQELKTILSKTLIDDQELIGEIFVEFVNWRNRRKAAVILSELSSDLQVIPAVKIEVSKVKNGPSTGKAIAIEVMSKSSKGLIESVDIIRNYMAQIPGAINIDDNLDPDQIEWQIKIDRVLAAKSGVDLQMVGQFVKLITNGIKVTSYRPDHSDEEIDIRLRFPENKRNLNQLDNLYIVNRSGDNIPIKSFVKRIAKIKTKTIIRIDGIKAITIEADVAEGSLPDKVVNNLKEWLDGEGKSLIPEHIIVKFAGEDEKQKRTQEFLKNAFIFSMLGMFFIMLVQFNNVYITFVIISAVFLSTAGVLLGLLVTGQPFGVVMCGIGVIALAGTVVNNNIIFIDTYNVMLRNKLKSSTNEEDSDMSYLDYSKIPRELLKDILLRTGLQRMRPILLTAGTGVLGLLPMVFAINIDFIAREITYDAPAGQWWRQLSTAIAGGLSFATILTLLFTPCLILFGYDISNKMKKLLRK